MRIIRDITITIKDRIIREIMVIKITITIITKTEDTKMINIEIIITTIDTIEIIIIMKEGDIEGMTLQRLIEEIKYN